MISKKEYEILSEVQELPLVSNPFEVIAERLLMKKEVVLEYCQKLLEEKKIRRFGASVAHRMLGFTSNPMTAVKVPMEKLDEVGKLIALEPDVTHCYSRSGFLYTIFFIIHGKNKDDSIKRAKEIVGKTGISEYKIYFSTKEYKKTPFRLPRR
ncbi:MAG: siroheme decarboxylase subunit beta [Promethearchaeota archaeon]